MVSFCFATPLATNKSSIDSMGVSEPLSSALANSLTVSISVGVSGVGFITGSLAKFITCIISPPVKDGLARMAASALRRARSSADHAACCASDIALPDIASRTILVVCAAMVAVERAVATLSVPLRTACSSLRASQSSTVSPPSPNSPIRELVSS